MANPLIELPRTVATTITVAATLVAGKHTPVDATAGAITVTLPAPVSGAAGAHLSVEKIDSSANVITVTGDIRGASGSVTLNYPHETLELRADSTGAWFPTSNHLPKSAVASMIAAQAASDSATYVPLLGVLATVSTAFAATVGKTQPYNAASGALAPALPALSGLTTGSTYVGVQKAAADTSTNLVVVTAAAGDTFDSGATTLSLKAPGEIRTLQVVTIGSTKYWKVVGGNTPLSYFDTAYAALGTTLSLTKPVAARGLNGGKGLLSAPTVSVNSTSVLTGPWFRTRTGGGGSGSTVDTTAPFLYVGVSANPLDAIAPHPTNSFPWYNGVVSTHKTVANTVNPTHVIRFITDASAFEVDLITTGGNVRVSIDGQWTAEQMLTVATGEKFLSVTGLDGTPKLISIEQTGCAFAGVRVDTAGASIVKPQLTGPTMLVFGDSYTSGAQQTLMGYARRVGTRLGIDNLIESGVGSTGYTTDGTTGNVRFVTRIPNDVTARNPSIVLVAGGRNDGSASAATIQAASATFWQTLRTALPDAFLVCVGPYFETSAAQASWMTVQSAIFAGATGYADAFIDTCTNPIFTGTGNTTTPKGDGNADTYINGSDLPHPTLLGQNYLADWLATRITPLLPGTGQPVRSGGFSPIPPSHPTTVYIPSSEFRVNAGVPSESTKGIMHSWVLDSATSEAVSMSFIPRDRMRGWKTFVADIVWTSALGGAGDVRWRFDAAEFAPSGGTITNGGGTVMTATAPASSTTLASRPAVTVSITSTDDLFVLRVYRLGADAADTLNEDAAFLGLRLTRAS